jgi:tetratricopeptide (TPR) repeat protein
MNQIILIMAVLFTGTLAQAQLKLPNSDVNHPSVAGRKLGVTDILIHYNSPGVKGREGKIWGTDIAPFGFQVLGYGSDMPSPWRAGANECTTIEFSTDVLINGKKLAAGKYAFFIALYADSSTLIFNRNTESWGAYFYNKDLDVLHVSATQQKNRPQMVERLIYTFGEQTKNKVELALEWERWRIPFTVEVDLTQTTLASIRTQLTTDLGFDPPSLEAGANWCLQNNVNIEEAYGWIKRATDPNLGAVQSFRALSIKAGLLEKMGRKQEADQAMASALEMGSAVELHQYGRQLLSQQKNAEAFAIFEKNWKKHKGAWPTNAGMMRGYSAMGNYKKALEHAKLALAQAPDEQNKKFIKGAIKSLSEGKAL